MNADLTRTNGHIGAVEKSFSIIEQLYENGPMGVSALAADLDASKSTVHNHLATLTTLGFVVRAGDQYRLGLQFLTLGDAARQEYELYDAVREDVDALARDVGERVQVMVEEAGRGVYIYRSKADQAVQTDSHIGTIVDLHTTAVGKAYLAFCDDETRNRILGQGLDPKTPNSVTDREVLEAELDEIREQGHAFNDEERTLGMRAVGAPIVSDDGELLGSLSISGPTTRMNGTWYESDVPDKVKQTCRVIGIKATYS